MADVKNEREDQTYRSSEVDDQPWEFRVVGDPDEPTLPEGKDFGSVNTSDEADDVNEQIYRQMDVRAYEADGTPVERGERESEDVVEGDEQSEDEKDSKDKGDEDATPVTQSDKNA